MLCGPSSVPVNRLACCTQSTHSHLPESGSSISAMDTTRLNHRTVLGAAATAGLLSVGGTSAWALDRFVIDHAQITSASTVGGQQTTVEASATASAADGVLTQSGYTSDTTRITITKKSAGQGDSALAWYVADVQLSDATLLRTAFAQDSFGTNIIATTSETCSRFGGLVALNGDYYGFRSTGIVVRNGVAFRDAGAWQTWSFGPGVVDQAVVVPGIDQVEIDTNVGNHSIQGRQPRTAIGMVAANHFLLVAVDGRSSGYSVGLTLPDLTSLMQGLGCRVAYNLDGGGSTTMVFDGSLVNNPLGRGRECGTSDMIYLTK